ncbi:sporulation protein YqfD [Clostridium frigidicarnis]|uniref:Similar to stage IV sporulation protein n=1 Tax=Clostridium frigidicarnis TaxID=84698 RepID=A0A1I0VHE3_9CLOT|nr:sporulation protein YqfD [Clostridium frigidicarnis]SFA75732.1 similar to stage IV sporulation protein [Clostridium frigidicarnis]
MNKNIKEFLKRGCFVIEIQNLHPEKIINTLWKSGINVRNIRRESIVKWIIEVDSQDYSKVRELVKENNGKLKIIKTKGLLSYFIKVKSHGFLYVGILVFFMLIYGYSCYIWDISINTDKYLSPFEVRKYLLEEGIKPGTRKNSINVYDTEKRLMEKDSRIMWARARFEGSRFKVDIEERQNPPKIVEQDNKDDIVAKMDAEIIRVYTTKGTSLVKKGDMVKAGDVLIKGVQGKEESLYETPAEGDVIAKTFYEDKEQVPIKGVRREQTGNMHKSIYIEIMGKKLYLKKCEDKFEKYDKIEESGLIFKKTDYYEVKENEFQLDKDETINELSSKMKENMKKNLDKSSKILDTIVKDEIDGDNLIVRVVFVVEQNIADKPAN